MGPELLPELRDCLPPMATASWWGKREMQFHGFIQSSLQPWMGRSAFEDDRHCVGWLKCPLTQTSESCKHGIHPTVGASKRAKGHWKCSLTLLSDPAAPVLGRVPSLTPEEHTCTLVPGEVCLEPVTSPGQWQEQLDQPRSEPDGAEAAH